MKRTLLLMLGGALFSAGVISFAPGGPGIILNAIIVGLIYGAGFGLLVEAYLRLRLRLGTYTTVLAFAVVLALLGAAYAWLAPTCPATTLTDRCPTRYVGVWSLIGLSIPIILGLLAFPLYLLGKFVILMIDVRRGRRRLPVPKLLASYLKIFGIDLKDNNSRTSSRRASRPSKKSRSIKTKPPVTKRELQKPVKIDPLPEPSATTTTVPRDRTKNQPTPKRSKPDAGRR